MCDICRFPENYLDHDALIGRVVKISKGSYDQLRLVDVETGEKWEVVEHPITEEVLFEPVQP